MLSALLGPEARDEAFLPYRHLAIRVLACALRDVAGDAGSHADRESARRFFAGCPMFFHWCRVAALDPHLVARHATRLRTRSCGPVGWEVKFSTEPSQ